MKDTVVAFLVKLGFAALDHWLDQRIKAQGWPAATKARAQAIEDELVRYLEPIIGELAKSFAPRLVGKALKRAFPNDPTTGDWG